MVTTITPSPAVSAQPRAVSLAFAAVFVAGRGRGTAPNTLFQRQRSADR
jgi:hypothetical protein